MEKRELKYRVVRSDRRTVAIQILPGGEVLVRCNRTMRDEAVHAFVRSKSDWIERQLRRCSGEQSEPELTQEQLQDLIQSAKTVIPERVAYYAPLVGVDYGRITIRTQHSRWGSCSGKGNLNFNCLLMLAPPQVLDYVVVHELCHRKQMNHSPAFWAEVERILPSHTTARKWLKDNGPSLIGRLQTSKEAQAR